MRRGTDLRGGVVALCAVVLVHCGGESQDSAPHAGGAGGQSGSGDAGDRGLASAGVAGDSDSRGGAAAESSAAGVAGDSDPQGGTAAGSSAAGDAGLGGAVGVAGMGGAAGAPVQESWPALSPASDDCTIGSYQVLDVDPSSMATALSTRGCILWLHTYDWNESPRVGIIQRWTEATGQQRLNPEGTSAFIDAVSRDGSTVAGRIYDLSADSAPPRSFIWNFERGLQWIDGEVVALNGDGSLAGGSSLDDSGRTRAAVWETGRRTLRPEGAVRVYGTSSDGQVLYTGGSRWSAGAPPVPVPSNLPVRFVSTNGDVVLVAGGNTDQRFGEVLVWDGDAMIKDPAGVGSGDVAEAMTMSDDGVLIGFAYSLIRRDPEHQRHETIALSDAFKSANVDTGAGEPELLRVFSGDGNVIAGDTADNRVFLARLPRDSY